MPEATHVLFVCSSGGHLDQLLTLLPAPAGIDVAFATFSKPDALEKVRGYRNYPLHWPTNRNMGNLLRNTLVAARALWREKPDVVVSSGAAAAVPFFYIARLFLRRRTVFIECVDRVSLPTMTAKLLRPVTDAYVTQWPTQLDGYPNRVQLSPSR